MFRTKAAFNMKALIVLISLSAAGLLFLWSGGMKKSYSLISVVITSPKPSSPDESIANATLGFQEVAVISLKSRPDRRKGIVDAARTTNISLTILNAIKDEEMLTQYVPMNWNDQEHPPGELGAYFSHMRVLDRIIDENISTSLILESDADWDVRIRESLTSVAKGVKNLMDYTFTEDNDDDDDDQASSSQSSPYGDYWDVLWLGHCGALGPYQGRVYSFNDSTAPPKKFEYAILGTDPPDPYERPDNLRAVHPIYWTLCTYAYAVTLKGARKLRNAGQKSSEPWDLRLNNICRDIPSVRCASVSPQLFTAAFSPTTIDYDGQMLPALTNPDNDKLGPIPGPAIQISARRNSQLAPGVSPQSWILEWR